MNTFEESKRRLLANMGKLKSGHTMLPCGHQFKIFAFNPYQPCPVCAAEPKTRQLQLFQNDEVMK